MNLKKYTLPQLIEAVKKSTSTRECLARLGVAPMGGNYDVFRKAVKFYNIDISHFTGQAGSGEKLKGKNYPRKSLDDLLRADTEVSSNKLRLRLIREGVFKAECACCNGVEWLGQPMPLELDHINGNNTDNRIENLRLLCPNCHAQTPTHRGKNKRLKAVDKSVDNLCLTCG